ncbi:MAG: restriction endonuclease subunit S, partial [Chloroflexota bacterium]|nr:restriction endonuclease subunit S [Chloroflexota bacterium]
MINETQWRTVTLSDVCSLRVDTIAPQDALELPYVGLEHIDSRQPTLSRTGNAAEVRSAKNRFQRSDVLYGKLRPYLDKAVLATRDGMCSTDILVLHPKEQIESDYLVNLVHSRPFIEHATKTTHGVNHPRTSWSGIGQFQFSIPPLAEQRAIAHVLATVQKAKEARQRELALEREHKAALMEYLFTFGIGDQKREVEERTHGRSPSDWDVRLLDECAFIQTGVAKGRRLSSAEVITVPYLRVANVQNGYLDLSEMKEITIRKSELARYQLADGDVVLTEGGDFDKLGRGFVWGGQVAPCV